MRRDAPIEPWRSFLADLDGLCVRVTDLHCMGGFALVHAYGLARSTVDIDVLSVVPRAQCSDLIDRAGRNSHLHRKHGVCLDLVTVATAPESYETRMRAVFPGRWDKLSLFALEPHDLALTKLERNSERDRADVQFLARSGFLNAPTLRQRYLAELRPYLLGRETWHDQTLAMWIAAYLPHDAAEAPSR